MSKLTVVMGLTALMSFSAYAQMNTTARSESGSGNGSLSRDVLDFETKLEDAQLSAASLEEAFEKLKEALRKMGQYNVPNFSQAPSDIWNNLTEQDMKVIVEADNALLDLVSSQVREVEVIKKRIAMTQAQINALAKEYPNYESRGYLNAFKVTLKKKEADMITDLRLLLEKMFIKLRSPIVFSIDGSSDIGTNLKRCQSVVCVDIISQKFLAYSDSYEVIKNIKLNLIGVKNESLAQLFLDKYSIRTEHENFQKLIRKETYKHILRINERAINDINN